MYQTTSEKGLPRFSMASENPIGSTTPLEDITSALARRGCPDLTLSIELATCSTLPLAGGGFCDVFRGFMHDGTKIAIKSLRLYDKPGKDANREKTRVLKRAAREMYYWSKLKHRNVLPLIGLAIFRGHLSMMSEWMENGNLMTYIENNPGADRTNLYMGVCAGLRYIHENEMVHGDLKAANVMVSRDGTALIADFGNSQLRDLTLRFTNTTGSSVSIRWAAPELLDEDSGQHLSKKADVYAYGMTLLEILTGKVPYDEFSERRVMIMVALKRKTPARPKVNISDELWAVLQCCWAWDHSERPVIANVEKRLQASLPRPSVEVGATSNFRNDHSMVGARYTCTSSPAEVSAQQGWADALAAIRTSPHLPHLSSSRNPFHSNSFHNAAQVAGPPRPLAGAPSDIKKLVVMGARRAQEEQTSVPPAPTELPSSCPKPLLKLSPWNYPPIDEDAITSPSTALSEIPAPPVRSLGEGAMSDAVLYDFDEFESETELESEFETETETELETELESDAGPNTHRPRVHVVIDDSEPTTPEFEAEKFCPFPPYTIPRDTTTPPACFLGKGASSGSVPAYDSGELKTKVKLEPGVGPSVHRPRVRHSH